MMCHMSRLDLQNSSFFSQQLYLDKDPESYRSLSMYWAGYDRKSAEGIQAMYTGIDIYVCFFVIF